MRLFEIILIAVSLAMDAFAVSIAAGTSGRLSGRRATFRLSFHFGLFQFMMPVIGWYAGMHIAPLISAVSHWVAFGLLAFVGGRMIISALHPDAHALSSDPSKGLSLVMLSFATSMDALVIGFSLAMIHVNIWYPSAMIGLITAGLSLAGITLGRHLEKRIGPRMEIIGGIVLIVIGIVSCLRG